MDEAVAQLRSVVGSGPSEATLRALLARTEVNGDVNAAANAFFGAAATEAAAEGESPQSKWL